MSFEVRVIRAFIKEQDLLDWLWESDQVPAENKEAWEINQIFEETDGCGEWTFELRKK